MKRTLKISTMGVAVNKAICNKPTTVVAVTTTVTVNNSKCTVTVIILLITAQLVTVITVVTRYLPKLSFRLHQTRATVNTVVTLISFSMSGLPSQGQPHAKLLAVCLGQ